LNNTTVSKGGIATSVVVAFVTILVWVLGGFHLAVPQYVQDAMIVILTPAIHTLAIGLKIDGPAAEAPPAVKVEPHLSASPLARS
jgi:hypothetical protein